VEVIGLEPTTPGLQSSLQVLQIQGLSYFRTSPSRTRMYWNVFRPHPPHQWITKGKRFGPLAKQLVKHLARGARPSAGLDPSGASRR